MPLPSLPERKVPGLKSLHVAREARSRGRYSRANGKMWLVGAGVALLSLVTYKIVSTTLLNKERGALLSKQKAVTATLGVQWFPIRDQLEEFTQSSAKHFDGDFIDPEIAKFEFRSRPGIYLRLRVLDATNVDAMRKATAESKRDAFVACLLREPRDISNKEDEALGGSVEQPWNLQQAYSATRILSDPWTAEVQNAGDSLRLKIFQEQYERAIREDIPHAIDMMKRAQFFLLVLDEDVPQAVPDGGTITERALQLVPHPARIHLFDLKNGKELLRLKRVGEASFAPAGDRPITDIETRQAMQRQVNNCALAKLVQSELAARGIDPGH